VGGTLDGRTVHVVCISDPVNSYSAIYTNGVLESSLNGSVPALSGVSAAFSFLGRSLFASDAWLNASIDEFRIYDGRLTPAEIAADYSFGPDALAMPIALTYSNSTAGITLNWPAYAVGFALESTPTLSPAQWSTVASAPQVKNNSFELTLPTTNSNQFFRLHQ
jgi:hypothetical protein